MLLFLPEKAADKNSRAAAGTSRVGPLYQVKAALIRSCECEECDSLLLYHIADPRLEARIGSAVTREKSNPQ